MEATRDDDAESLHTANSLDTLDSVYLCGGGGKRGIKVLLPTSDSVGSLDTYLDTSDYLREDQGSRAITVQDEKFIWQNFDELSMISADDCLIMSNTISQNFIAEEIEEKKKEMMVSAAITIYYYQHHHRHSSSSAITFTIPSSIIPSS